MGSTNRSAVAAALGPWRAARALPAVLERLDRVEESVAEANRRIDDLQERVAAIGAVRSEVRDLTEHLTEELDRISDSLNPAEGAGRA